MPDPGSLGTTWLLGFSGWFEVAGAYEGRHDKRFLLKCIICITLLHFSHCIRLREPSLNSKKHKYMPSAGDSNNLRPNLRTLAQLRTKLGAKLSYDKNRGRFSIQEAGIRQSLTRTFSSDSVKSEEYFEKPIRELFAAAHAERADRDDDDDFTDALAGLKSLRKS